MRAVLTRVKHASVSVDGKVIGQIGEGFLVLLGVTHEDTEAQAVKLADKLTGLRIFEDEHEKMNRSLTDASGKPVFYEYDWRGNLSAVKDGNGKTLAAYAHTPGGKLKEIRHGNGIRTGYEYDTDGNLVHLHMEHTDGEIMADLYYSHDLNGNFGNDRKHFE